MAKINLDKLDLNDLKQLRKDVDKAIADFEQKQKREARDALEKLAKEKGFTLAELASAPAAKKTKPTQPPKYKHPENPSMTWSGRGRQPGWIKEHLEAGKSIDEFLIKK